MFNKPRAITILGMLASLMLLTACAQSGPAAAAKTFIHALASGNTDQVISMVYFESLDNDTARAMAEDKIKKLAERRHEQVQSYGGLASVEITHVQKTDEKHATVEFILHFNNGETDEGEYELAFINGQWQLVL